MLSDCIICADCGEYIDCENYCAKIPSGDVICISCAEKLNCNWCKGTGIGHLLINGDLYKEQCVPCLITGRIEPKREVALCESDEENDFDKTPPFNSSQRAPTGIDYMGDY